MEQSGKELLGQELEQDLEEAELAVRVAQARIKKAEAARSLWYQLATDSDRKRAHPGLAKRIEWEIGEADSALATQGLALTEAKQEVELLTWALEVLSST